MENFEGMNMAAMMGKLGELFGNLEGDITVEKRQKEPPHIFADAQLSGMKSEVNHLRCSISEFYDKVVEQGKKLKNAKEEQDSLRENLSKANRREDILKYRLCEFAEEKKALRDENANYAAKLSEAESKVAELNNVIKQAMAAIDSVGTSATKPKLQVCIKDLGKILANSNGNETQSSVDEKNTVPLGKTKKDPSQATTNA